MSYSKLGTLPIIPAADLLDMQSAANIKGVGASRIGDSPNPLGKVAGMLAMRDAGSSNYSMVFATGGNPSDVWRAADGSASYTPLNLSTWTVGGNSTYSAGLLTTDGSNGAAGRVVQTITGLAAGKYIVTGTSAAEGTVSNHTAPRLAITGSVTGALVTKIFRTYFDATAAENATVKEAFAYELTVPTAENVTFTMDIVDEADALIAGSAYITLNALESIF